MGKLAAVTCEKAKPNKNGRDRLLGDGDGLFLRIRPHGENKQGTKTWVVEYEFQGRRRKSTIGVYDSAGAPGESISAWLDNGRLSLTQARSVAGQWKADRRAGRDPLREWDEHLAAARAIEVAKAAELTVQQTIDQFLVKHIVGKKSATGIKYRLDRFAEYLGDKKIRAVTRHEVIAAIERIAEGQRERTAKLLAGEVLIQAKRVWRFAHARELIDSSCIASLTRSDFDARPNKRSVALRMDELAELWRVLIDPVRCKADAVTVAALQVVILTGQREREVTDAEWTEFNLTAGVWAIPAGRTKTGRAHLVHLAPQALAILEELKAVTGRSRHVFESPLRRGQAVFGRSVNNALQILFKRGVLANVTPCHVHDLRRTLITRLPDLGFEPFIGHKIANHVLPGVMAHYNHNEYLAQRQAALKNWAEEIEALATNRPRAGAEIIPLHRTA